MAWREYGWGRTEHESTEITETLFLLPLSPLLASERLVHVLFRKASRSAHEVTSAAIGIHEGKGSGPLESICAWRLTMDLQRVLPAPKVE